MSIARTLALSLAGTIILAAHPATSSAMTYTFNQTFVTSIDSDQDDGESLWDYICSWL